MQITLEGFLEAIVEVAEASTTLSEIEQKNIRGLIDSRRIGNPNMSAKILATEISLPDVSRIREYFRIIFGNRADYYNKQLALAVAARLGIVGIFDAAAEAELEEREGEEEVVESVINNERETHSHPAEKLKRKPKRKADQPLLTKERKRTPIPANMFDLLHPQTHILFKPAELARDGSEWIVRLSPDNKRIESKELLVPGSKMSAAQIAEYEEAWRDKTTPSEI